MTVEIIGALAAASIGSAWLGWWLGWRAASKLYVPALTYGAECRRQSDVLREQKIAKLRVRLAGKVIQQRRAQSETSTHD
jgi:hypothetical protein